MVNTFPSGDDTILLLLSRESRSLIPVPTLNVVSRVPSVLVRAILFTEEPPNVVKPPNASIFPSGCTSVENTVVLRVPALNVVSRVPFVFKRTNLETDEPL